MRSRLQKEVLKLYRQLLVASKGKDGFREHIQREFRKHASLPKTDGMRIEYLLRRGEHSLRQLKKTECQSMGYFVKDSEEAK